MKELIRQQGQCLKYAKDAAKSLSDFFKKKDDEGLFYVSFSNEKGFGKTEPEPNAATSIICRVIASLDTDRGKALCENDVLWVALEELVKQATKYVVKSELSKALPLKSMGKLPLHSIAHLTQLLLHYDSVRETGSPSIFEFDVLAISIRRLIVAIELDLEADNHNFRERLHPYHLYVLSRALIELKKNLNAGNIDAFKSKLLNCESALIDAIKTKYNPPAGKKVTDKEAKSDLEFNLGAEWKKIDKKISLEYFSPLFSRIEERSVVMAQAQIANKASSVNPDFDPSSLAFAIATLSELRTERYRHIVRQGLDLLLQVFEEDDFASTIPFMVDDKGRAAFVPSVETANILLKVCEEQLKESRAAELERAANVALRFQRRLEETKQSANHNGQKISGWCSDKAPSKGRIDSWVTVYALEFFYRSHEIVKLEKRRTIFEDYSWRSNDKCKPKWDEIIDPNYNPAGANDDKEPIKSKIMNLIKQEDKRRRAPVFLLYGPPGTSKTSFVNGVAHAKNWDLISLSPSDFISDSVDRIEHRARKIFHDLMNIDECVVLFDEMDSLLLDRDGDSVKGDDVLKFVVPAFLPKLQDLHDHVVKSQMAVFFVTNYAERIDSAIKRKGRIDEKILIPPYNEAAREALLRKLLVDVAKLDTDIVKHADSLPQITTALSMMSPMSVYREIVEFAYCFSCEAGKIKLDETKAKLVYSDGLSIPPKTYDYILRGEGAAREEFLEILARIAEKTTVNRERWMNISEKKEAEDAWTDARRKVTETFNCEKDFSQWEAIIKKWLGL